MLKKIITYSLAVFFAVQFIPLNRTNKPVNKSENMADLYDTPPKVLNVLRKACYDCHSNETKYPSYAYIAPFSWSLKTHVNEGRKYMNMSEWANYNRDQKKGILEKSIKTIELGTMPMPAYTAWHPEANLKDAEKLLLINYFQSIQKQENY